MTQKLNIFFLCDCSVLTSGRNVAQQRTVMVQVWHLCLCEKEFVSNYINYSNYLSVDLFSSFIDYGCAGPCCLVRWLYLMVRERKNVLDVLSQRERDITPWGKYIETSFIRTSWINSNWPLDICCLICCQCKYIPPGGSVA